MPERPPWPEVEQRAYDRGVEEVHGVFAERPPDTYAELVDIVAAARCGSAMSDEIDKTLELIGTSTNPDEIVAMLPFDEEDSMVVLILDDYSDGQ